MGQARSSLKSLHITPVSNRAIDAGPQSARLWDGRLDEDKKDRDKMPPIRFPFSDSVPIVPRSVSPAPSTSGRKSPFHMPPRSATAPLSSRPPSSQMPLPQDSAFPRFPIARSQTSIPSTQTGAEASRSRIKEEEEAKTTYRPSSSRENGGDSVLKRMDSIAPGPFHVKGESGAWMPKHHQKSPSKTNSRDLIRSSSLSSSRPYVRRPSTSSSVYTRNTSLASIPGAFQFGREKDDVPAVPSVPSTVDSPSRHQSRATSNITQSEASSFDFGTSKLDDRGNSHDTELSSVLNEDLNREDKTTPSTSKTMGHKPQPSLASAMAPLHEIGSTSSFRPSKSLRGHRTATTTVDIQRTNAPQKGDVVSQTRLVDMSSNPSTSSKVYDIGNPYHTPHESVSSNGSSSSGVKSGSSRSSPPLTESPRPAKTQTAEGNDSNGFQGFQFGVEERAQYAESQSYQADSVPQASPNRDDISFTTTPTRKDSFTSPLPTRDEADPATPSDHEIPSPDFPSVQTERPRVTGPGTYGPPPDPTPGYQGSRPGTPSRYRAPPPESAHHHNSIDYLTGPTLDQHRSLSPARTPTPISPQQSLPVRPGWPAAIQPLQPPQRKNSSPLTSPDDYIISAFPDQPHNNLHLIPAQPPPPPVPGTSTNRRPSPVSKGRCRGCNENIFGKSVSSADGQLTGRYHKQCFVCTTCAAPFPAMDFYVSNNHPYCARHYHEINNSICGSCDRGIEGAYLEMLMDPLLRKFHPHCFTCQDCHLILREDYYEWNGRVLCEQHAFGAAQRHMHLPSSLGPGRKYPEKRSTRLMMM